MLHTPTAWLVHYWKVKYPDKVIRQQGKLTRVSLGHWNDSVYKLVLDSLFELRSIVHAMRGLFTGKLSAGQDYRQRQLARMCLSHWSDTASRQWGDVSIIYWCIHAFCFFVWHRSAIGYNYMV